MSWKIVFPSLDHYPQLEPADVRAFETRNRIVLPRDYVKFLLKFRGSVPALQDDKGHLRTAKFPVVWGDKPANSLGTECHLHATFSLFGGKPTDSPLKNSCNLDHQILRNAQLHPPGLLPVGGNRDSSLFMLSVAKESHGKMFLLSPVHAKSPASFDHIGFIAQTFGAFLRAARPGGPFEHNT